MIYWVGQHQSVRPVKVSPRRKMLRWTIAVGCFVRRMGGSQEIRWDLWMSILPNMVFRYSIGYIAFDSSVWMEFIPPVARYLYRWWFWSRTILATREAVPDSFKLSFQAKPIFLCRQELHFPNWEIWKTQTRHDCRRHTDRSLVNNPRQGGQERRRKLDVLVSTNGTGVMDPHC